MKSKTRPFITSARIGVITGFLRDPWGVSNNVRPSLRALRFAEAAFKVAGATPRKW
jgi:uncharacterized protein (DUF2141 family)